MYVGGGLSLKVLDVASLHSEVERTLADLDSFQEQIKQIQKGVDGIASLEDSFKGKGAQAIRSFYQEVHVPFLLFFEGFIADFQDTLKQMTRSLEMLEPDKKGFIRQSFLENVVQKDLNKVENITTNITDEANHTIASIRDIIPLPSLDDGEFRHHVDRSRRHANETIDQLHQFDAQSTRALEPVANDLHLMSNYIQQISGMFENGKLNVENYATRQLSDNEAYKGLIQGVKKKGIGNAFSIDVMLASGAKYILSHYMPLAGTLVDHLLKSFERRTMDYSVRAMNVLIAVSGKTISYEEFQTLKGKIVNAESVVDYKGELDGKYHTLLDGRIARQYQAGENKTAYQFVNSIPKDRYKPKAEPGPIKKSLNSLGEIGNDFTTAWEERSDKARDSLYDFGNHLTFGAFDMGKNVWEGNQALYQKKMNSPADFANWLSMGSVDMVRGVISPEEQFSKEHWQNSFELFTIVAGGGLARVNTGPTPKTVPTVRVPKKPINMPVKQWVSQLKPPVIKSVTNTTEWFRANFFNFDFQRRQFAVDMPGGNNGYYFVKDDFEGGARSSGRGTGDFTTEVLKAKPMNSPIPKKWYKKGGNISIDDNGTWTYTNKSGVSVSYPNGYPDFTPYTHPNVKSVKIDLHSPKNNPKDFENANIAAKLTKDTDPPIIDIRKPPEGYTWHHHQDGKTMMLVDEDIHREFRHIGGQSKVNGKSR